VEAKSIIERPDGRGPGGADAGAEDLRSRLHGMWGAVAAGWAEHAEYVDARGAEVT
jgi:hypothetical protein